MANRVTGGVLLIVGTSLGGGMLALPMATAAAGYWHALGLFLAIWLLTLISAFYTLEASMYLPEGSHFVSMAKRTWGKGASFVVGALLWFFLYVLLSTYTAGGSSLVAMATQHWHLISHDWVNTVLFTLIFGLILYRGVSSVDWVNRSLMAIKLLAYLLLVVTMVPGSHLSVEPDLPWHHVSGAVLVVMTAFGFGGSIPTIRSYCQSHVRSLVKVIIFGSLIPLLAYLVWDWVVQGSVPIHGEHGLITMAHAPHAVAALTKALSNDQAAGHVAKTAVAWFTSLCVTTSYLGVGIGLVDFIADALSIDRHGPYAWVATALAVIPPMLIVMWVPGLFMQALAYAGALCVLLLVLFPALMVWRGRYTCGETAGFQVPGGRPLVILVTVVGVLLFGFSCYQLWVS